MTLPFARVAGDPHAVGFRLGQAVARFAAGRLVHSEAWRALAPWRGSTRVIELERHARAAFPRYVREIEGMAAGAGLDFADVFLWNCRGDLVDQGAEGCTTLMVPGSERRLIGHNEDGDPALRDGCLIAEVRPDDGPSFVSFVYPLSIPGHSFAVNSAGLVQTVNNLRAARADGLPRQLCARAVLDQPTLDDALALLGSTARASGYHHALAHAGDRRLISVEAPAGGLSVMEARTPLSHANHIVMPGLREIRQTITPSSAARQAQARSWCAARNAAPTADDLRAFLAGRRDARFPIWRSEARPPDDEVTFATCIFAIGSDGIAMSVFTAPRGGAALRAHYAAGQWSVVRD